MDRAPPPAAVVVREVVEEVRVGPLVVDGPGILEVVECDVVVDFGVLGLEVVVLVVVTRFLVSPEDSSPCAVV